MSLWPAQWWLSKKPQYERSAGPHWQLPRPIREPEPWRRPATRHAWPPSVCRRAADLSPPWEEAGAAHGGQARSDEGLQRTPAAAPSSPAASTSPESESEEGLCRLLPSLSPPWQEGWISVWHAGTRGFSLMRIYEFTNPASQMQIFFRCYPPMGHLRIRCFPGNVHRGKTKCLWYLYSAYDPDIVWPISLVFVWNCKICPDSTVTGSLGILQMHISFMSFTFLTHFCPGSFCAFSLNGAARTADWGQNPEASLSDLKNWLGWPCFFFVFFGRGTNPFATVKLRPTTTDDRSAPRILWSALTPGRVCNRGCQIRLQRQGVHFIFQQNLKKSLKCEEGVVSVFFVQC